MKLIIENFISFEIIKKETKKFFNDSLMRKKSLLMNAKSIKICLPTIIVLFIVFHIF